MTNSGKIVFAVFGMVCLTIPCTYLTRNAAAQTSRPVEPEAISEPMAAKNAREPVPGIAQAQSAWAKLPVAFTQNRGQTDSRVRYFARGSRYAFFLASNEIVLSLAKNSGTPSIPARDSKPVGARGDSPFPVKATTGAAGINKPSVDGIALGLKFLGSNPNVVIDGEERAPGNANYLRGPNSAAWKTDVPRYSQVVYHELWRGIDLKVCVKEQTLKYEFHVHPGARVEDIRLAYRGSENISLDPNGSLLIKTGAGTIRDKAPVSFQEIGGREWAIESRYHLETATSSTYGFKVGEAYKPDQELIIDPGIEYSTFLGGSSDDVPTGVAVDGAGNVYVVGYTQSPDFPVTPGAFDRTGAASNSLDAFVAKVNPMGTALVYATFIGGSNFEWGRSIAVDSAGNAYITGQTTSPDFPVTGKAFQKTLAQLNCPRCGVDNYDAFVTKLNPAGSALVYSTYLGGAGSIDDGLAIAIDAAGNAYVAGETSSPDFPTTAGSFRRANSGGDDTFVSKLNPTGSALIYSTYIGGTQEEFPARIAVDTANNAIVFGNTSSPDFPVTPGTFDTTPNGGFDAFVLKLNAAGSNLVYSTFLGGSAVDSAGGLAIDQAGDVYVSGGTSSLNYPTTPGAFRPVCTGSDGFVTKLNATASALVYSTCLSGASSSAIAITPTGNAWITGGTSSTTFFTTSDAFQHSVGVGPSGPVLNAIIAELNATGSAFLYSTYLGGSVGDNGADLGLDSAGNAYVVGKTYSSDFPTTPNAFDRAFSGRLDIFWGDGFVAKLALNGTPPPPPAAPVIASMTGTAQVVGGNSFTVTTTLSATAQSGGAVVSLASNNPAVVLPATVTIPAGSQTGMITATSSAVSANTSVTITGSLGGVSKSAIVTLLPVPPPGTLSSVGMFPNTITGGTNTIGIIGLTNPAPAGGYTVTLSSNNPAASVPSSFTVPAGETTASFTVTTVPVAQSTALTIFAKAGTLSALGTLTVNPAAPPPPTTVTLTVSATGRTGEHVTSSPAGINVAVGSSMQASFTSGASVSLSVSNGRDAIWSGACSSGGSKTKSCTFTLNAAGTVTANVQ
jgi:Beta-propeller repeat